jgi:hypothetical protein
MSFFQWLILFAFVAAFAYYNRPALKKAWKGIRKVKPAHNHRMLVAIRRRSASLSRFLELSAQEQTALLKQFDAQWQDLVTRWQGVAPFAGSFTRSDQGLALQNEEEWAIIAFFDIPNYDAMMKCQTSLNESAFLGLRSFYDIRLIFGKKQIGKPGPISVLF